MHFIRSLLAAAPLVAYALAQSKVAFTSLPASIEAGESFNITWAGGNGSPVALTLRRGNPSDLNTVATIANSVEGYWFLWEVPSSIESGDDYALQITQGQSDINWTGLFTIEGEERNSTSTSTSTTMPSNSTMSITSAASASGTGTAMIRNSTFSSATLTASDDSPFTFGSSETSTTRSASRTSSSSSATSTPSNHASVKAGSSAALILGIVAAVMLH